MKIRATVVCIPVQRLDKTLTFYKNVFGLPDLQVEEGMIAVELPNLSLFLMDKEAFEAYSLKAGRAARLPEDNAAAIISCALTSKEEVDKAFEDALQYGGKVAAAAAIDESFCGYVGYITDPDGHLWELVFPPQQPG